MRKGKDKRLAFLAILLVSALLAGCGSSGADSSSMDINGAGAAAVPSAAQEAYYDEYGMADYDGGSGEALEEELSELATGESSSGAAALSDRKLIRTVDMEVETKEYDQLLSALEAEVAAKGGYIESMDSYNGSSYSSYRSARYAYLVLRIPKDKLDSFLALVSDIGNVVRRSDSVEDVTLRYVDLASHRNALRTEQERLLALLEQAENIEDIITIENRLSNVRYQLESMESQLRTMDNQVDYSTVRLNVSEVKELTPVAERTVWERISDGFVESLADIGDGAVEFAIWFVVNIPYLVIWAVVIVAAVFVLRLLFRRRRARKEARKKEKYAASVQPAVGSSIERKEEQQNSK